MFLVLLITILNMLISGDYMRTQTIYYVNVTSDAPCTFHIISQHIRDNGYFIQTGEWIGINNTSITSSTRGFYDPGICALKRRGEHNSWLSSCLHQTKTLRIVFLGDSNQRKSTQAFIANLEDKEGMKCHDKQNHTQRNAEGYLDIDKSDKRKCSWFYTWEFSCSKYRNDLRSSENFVNITVQYVQMFWLRENVSFVNVTTASCPDVVNKSVNTIQEYILDEYAARTKPDLIILGATAHTRYLSVKLWTEDQRWLMDQVDKFLPKSTSVVWLSQMSWRENKLTKLQNHVNRVYDNGATYTVNQQTGRHNVQFYKLLRTKLHEPRKNIFPFFDLYNISLMVQPQWYKDWIHGNRYFYDGLLEAIFETFCNSVLNPKVISD